MDDGTLGSCLCRQMDFSTLWYRASQRRIAEGAPRLEAEREAVWGPVWSAMRGKTLHRKLWEWCAIAQALDERGFLEDGRSGLGFAVGREPLASLFASRGVRVLATDLVGSGADDSWSATGQMASSLERTHWSGLVAGADYRERCEFRHADMRDLSGLDSESVDFVWSSCAFEHLGSLEAGLTFVLEAMRLVKPGGLAVHTTEYNVTSNDQTVETGPNVIYRKRDIESLDRRLRSLSCAIESLDLDPGSDDHDLRFDRPPYYRSGRQHIKLELLGHVSTSLLLIIRKAGDAAL
jgi:SAM-dependent methyltransferase